MRHFHGDRYIAKLIDSENHRWAELNWFGLDKVIFRVCILTNDLDKNT